MTGATNIAARRAAPESRLLLKFMTFLLFGDNVITTCWSLRGATRFKLFSGIVFEPARQGRRLTKLPLALKGKPMPARKLSIAATILFAGLILTTQQAMACACCNTYKVVHVASNDVLNIRSGPGVGYRKISSIPAGSACVIKTGRKRGKWHQVQYASTTGWVHSYYLRFMSRP